MTDTATTDVPQRIALTGRLDLASRDALLRDLAAMPDQGALVIDLSRAEAMDMAGGHALLAELDRRRAAGQSVRIEPGSAARRAMIALIDEVVPLDPDPAPRPVTATDHLASIGKLVVERFMAWRQLVGMLGQFLARTLGLIARPRRFPMTSLVAQADAAGLQAAPIVALISFLIGIVIGFQGALQLRQFGAEIYSVELIAISVLREFGILLTAIIVAGRTASAYTAVIGAMKMNEEIDAMSSMGIDPFDALVVPRILALLIVLPLLTLLADFAGLAGGMLMSWAALDISPSLFLQRLQDEVTMNHPLSGLVKAPFMAVLIGLIGCQGGLTVRGDAASLGLRTSASVVAAIFAVIVADAIFSIIFAQIGW